jgi:hypothetical protein
MQSWRWQWHVCAAMAHRGEIGNRAARGFNRSMHIAKENITSSPGPVYIGQTVIDVPATVIAQENRGAICVLAAFASEGASLRKHVETVVKPWLLANARWAFHNRRIIGICDADPRTQYELLEIINEPLGGDWDPATTTWEVRRESILDLLGKAAPFAFTPALQISPEASLPKSIQEREKPFWHGHGVL